MPIPSKPYTMPLGLGSQINSAHGHELFTYKHRPREFGNKIGALLLHWSRKPNRDVLHT